MVNHNGGPFESDNSDSHVSGKTTVEIDGLKSPLTLMKNDPRFSFALPNPSDLRLYD